MGKILRYSNFLESNLNLPELKKIRSGESRGQILVKKLKEESPLTTTDDEEVKIQQLKVNGEWDDIEDGIEQFTTNGKYDPEKAEKYFKKRSYIKVFQDDEGDEHSLNQFKKTSDFGLKGAGKRVREFESIQAIFLAIKQSNPDKELTPENAVKFFNDYVEKIEALDQRILYIPENIKITSEMIKDFVDDKDWIDTFCRIPNEIWKQKYHIDINKTYKIYQIGYSGESVVTLVKSLYRKFAISEKFTEINFAKWCPADIYLVDNKEEEEIKSKLLQCISIETLTSMCDQLFNDGLLVPLSLKKVKRQKDLKIITNREEGKELPTFYIRKFLIGSNEKGISSKIITHSYWKFRTEKLKAEEAERTITFDSSDSNKKQNIDGEIEGSASRHGKISWNIIKRFILTKYPQAELSDASDLTKKNVEELEVYYKELISRIEENDVKNKVLVREFTRGTDITGNEGKLISRIQSLQVIQAINNIYQRDSNEANIIMTDIMRYALSIKTDRFYSPRYLRVI